MGRRSADADRDVVALAEQVVDGAWMGELFDVVADTESAVRKCLRMRHAAMAAMRTAQIIHDPHRIVALKAVLEELDRALDDSRALRDGVRGLLAGELARRPTARAVRVVDVPGTA